MTNHSTYCDTFIREVRAKYHATGTDRLKIGGPGDVAAFVRSVLPDNSREHFVALCLDGYHQVAGYSVVASGTAERYIAHPREVLQRAILSGAVSMIVAHNHPSGDTTPNDDDLHVTRRLLEAAELVGIPLLDHVILSDLTHESIINRNR
jgi:DNA repair protein RadC